ncbi:MAG TPA: hypothetical protein VKJ07_18615, partial [Mycobacteriales bacterium]|nr:hypothetical protein [Mycobacteriales bacterium]
MTLTHHVAVNSVSVTDGNLLTLSFTNLFLAAGTTSVGVVITGSGIDVAVLSDPASSATWVGVYGTGLGANLAAPGVVADVSNLVLKLNKADGTTIALDWSNVSGASATVQSLPIDVSFFSVEGDLSNLSVASLITGSAHFTVGVQTVSLTLSDGSTVASATLLTLSLSKLQLRVGIGSFGLTIGDGTATSATVGIATIAPNDAADTRRWLAIVSSNLSVSLTLPVVSASIGGVAIQANRASGTAILLNWKTDVFASSQHLDVFAGGVKVELTPTTPLSISGTITLDFPNPANPFLHIHGAFDLTQGTASVKVSATETLVGASLLTFGVHDADITLGSTSGPNVFVQNGSIAIALLRAPAPTTGTDNRSWLAFEGSLGAAGLRGVDQSLFTLTASDVSVQVNSADGTSASGAAAKALDWTTQLDLDPNGTFGQKPSDQVAVGGTTIDMTGQLVAVSGMATLSLAGGLINGDVSFSFSQTQAGVLVAGVTVPATLTTFGLRTVNGGISIGPASLGFAITNGSLALAFLNATGTGDTREWIAVTAQLSGVTFKGGALLKITVDRFSV